MKTRLKIAATVLWTLGVLTALSTNWQAVGEPSTLSVWVGVIGIIVTLVLMPIGYQAIWRKR